MTELLFKEYDTSKTVKVLARYWYPSNCGVYLVTSENKGQYFSKEQFYLFSVEEVR